MLLHYRFFIYMFCSSSPNACSTIPYHNNSVLQLNLDSTPQTSHNDYLYFLDKTMQFIYIPASSYFVLTDILNLVP